MKTLTMILLLFSIINLNAQNTKEYVLPAILLASTAITVDVSARYVEGIQTQTLDQIALTGIAISAMSIIIIEKIKNNPPERRLKRKIKKHKFI